MLAQNSLREPSHTPETRTVPQDILTIRQEIEEKLQQKISRDIFRYWTLRNFSKQYNLDCENFYQFLQEDQHKFGALMYCSQDLPIHVSAFLKNLSKWINKAYFQSLELQSFRIKNAGLRDSMIEKETLMIFQVTRKRVNGENLFAKFEKTKGKLERFMEKYQQRKIRKAVFFIVSSQQTSCDEREVSWEYSEFVGGVPFEFGGILHLPSQLYFGGVKGLDRLLETFFGHIHQLEQLTNNERLLLQQDGQLQADLLQRERENIAREREEVNKEKEEINREKEEISRQREEIRKEREEELHRKRDEIHLNQQIDPLTNRFSGLMREENQFSYQAQPNIPPQSPQERPQTQAWKYENFGFSALQPQDNAVFHSQFNQFSAIPTVYRDYSEPSPVYLARINANLPDVHSNPTSASGLPKGSYRGYGEPIVITPSDSSAYYATSKAQTANTQNPWDREFI